MTIAQEHLKVDQTDTALDQEQQATRTYSGDLENEDLKTAIVLSGGAAHGSYHVGVLKALFQGIEPLGHRPVDPDVISGTSAGAFNAVSLLAQLESKNPKPVEYMEDVWLNRISRTGVSCGNGIFRIRGDMRRSINPGCYVNPPFNSLLESFQDLNFFALEAVNRGRQFIASTDRIEQKVLEQLNLSSFVSLDPMQRAVEETVPFDVLQREPDDNETRRSIRIGAVRLDTGELVYFDRDDLTVDVGPKIVCASAAIPGIFPFVDVNGVQHADGGVIENTPLQGAIEADADIIHVVTSFPKATNIPPDQSVNTLDSFWRMLVINLSSALKRDSQRIGNINNALKVLEILNESEGRGLELLNNLKEEATEKARQLLQDTLDRILSRPRPNHRQITVHIHLPAESLGGLLDFLNFDREYLQDLIRRGYHDTLSHNCEVNGCILPS